MVMLHFVNFSFARIWFVLQLPTLSKTHFPISKQELKLPPDFQVWFLVTTTIPNNWKLYKTKKIICTLEKSELNCE